MKDSRSVRLATSDDIAAIWSIDTSATMKFKAIPDLADLAVGETNSDKFKGWMSEGRVYLVEEGDGLVGLLAASIRDSIVYVNEIAVHAESQGKGIGAMFLSAAFEWAEERSEAGESEHARVSLTTYAEGISWNAPWYRKHGFKEVEAEPGMFTR